MSRRALRLSPSLASLILAACASAPPPAPPVAAQPPPAASPAPAIPPVATPVGTIDGQPVSSTALDAHQAATGLPRADALSDLIDLTLLRTAAAVQGIPLGAGLPTPEARAAAELAVAQKLKLEVPASPDLLVVDHAWVKDAPKKATTAAQRKSLEKLRGLVLSGQSLPEAFKTLPGVDGKIWHVGDHEEYPYGVVPAEAHDLPPGSVSPIIAGDGGLHLFKLHARKTAAPPADAVHALVRDELRKGHAIETVAP